MSKTEILTEIPEFKVKGIIFDLWGTLVYSRPRLSRADYESIADRIGTSTETIWRKWVALAKDAQRGVIKSGEERAQLVLAALGAPLEIAPSMVHFEYENRSADVHFYPGVPEMLAELHRRGYRTCLISNCSYLTPPVVERLHLHDMMTSVILSCNVGYIKPEMEIYQLGADEIGAVPNECLYIGDGGDDELTGAKLFGFRTGVVMQEHGHAHRHPHENYPVELRLEKITDLLFHLPEQPVSSTAA